MLGAERVSPWSEALTLENQAGYMFPEETPEEKPSLR